MRVAIIGGTGLIGTALGELLRSRGDEVLVLTRRSPRHPDEVQWDPRKGVNHLRRLDGVDAVVNLAGEPLATRPWTRARRRLLVASRVDATHALHASLRRLPTPPPVYVGVGALGRFGDRGDAWIDDDDPPGDGFLAELSVAWEDAHLAATGRLGARVAVLRMAVVLSARGGVFPHLVGPFRHHLGGWLGSGEQFTSWLSRRDAARALVHLVDTADCRGGFNGTIPQPGTNRAWCEALGRVVGTPVKGHAPRWALRGALGELADGLMLASLRARPRRLLDSGFSFVDSEVEPLMRRLVAEVDRLAI